MFSCTGESRNSIRPPAIARSIARESESSSSARDKLARDLQEFADSCELSRAALPPARRTESASTDDVAPHQQITSAIVHPHCVYLEQSEGLFAAGSILGERLPEEDVRVVETADSTHQQDVPVLPGAQRRKLYFNPAYFDRQLLLVSRRADERALDHLPVRAKSFARFQACFRARNVLMAPSTGERGSARSIPFAIASLFTRPATR